MNKYIDTKLCVCDVDNKLKTIPLEEVSCHESTGDCWMVICDKVYDVTNFLKQHPGGEDLLMEHAGRDATFAFQGAVHSDLAEQMLKEYLIGELPLDQRLYQK
ncbi:cytochrome b5-like [Onthophagus taurus]|uniref:cytochrome b5-like n=1 Tax=Onthophagus taurus TaxID=166361 RepID=UPI0039BE729D